MATHASQRREVAIQGGRVTRIEFQLAPQQAKSPAGPPSGSHDGPGDVQLATEESHAKLLDLLHTDADNPKPGAPMEEEKLQRLAWGPAAPNGLRAACYFELTKEAYADGEEAVRRLVFHSSDKEPVLSTYGSASENSHRDWVVVEEPIPVPVERQTGYVLRPGSGSSRLRPASYRLQPGKWLPAS